MRKRIWNNKDILSDHGKKINDKIIKDLNKLVLKYKNESMIDLEILIHHRIGFVCSSFAMKRNYGFEPYSKK